MLLSGKTRLVRGAARGTTRRKAVDFAALDIGVNGIASGFIDARSAIVVSGTPEDCGGPHVLLLSSPSRYNTGQVLTVDGGLTAIC